MGKRNRKEGGSEGGGVGGRERDGIGGRGGSEKTERVYCVWPWTYTCSLTSVSSLSSFASSSSSS